MQTSYKITTSGKETLALFDFDGTITTKDTLKEFLKYSLGVPKYFTGLVRFSPTYLLWKLGFVNADQAKEKLLAQHFKGMEEAEFKMMAARFSLEKIDTFTREHAIELMQKHKERGHRVIVVSASMSCWLWPWCDKNNVELLSTKLYFEKSKVAGCFSTPNCNHEEKLRRIENHLNIDDYKNIFAYGNSRGDDAMMSIATHSFRF